MWRITVLIIGLFALFVAYYWVHKPFNIALIFTLGGAFLDLLTVGVIVTVAGGFGRWALGWLNLDPLSRAERFALQGALGLGFLSWGGLLFGLIGLYRGSILWGTLLLVGILTARQSLSWLRDGQQLVRKAFQHRSAWTIILAVFLVFMLGSALLNTLTPPTAWDALTYHLVGPKLYLAAGRITTQPDNVYLGFPEQMEMLYGTALSLFGRDTAAAPIHFLYGLFGLLAVVGVAYRHAGVRAGWIAAALLLTSSGIWLLFSSPYVDLANLTYGALMLAVITAWRETKRSGWLIALGLIVGQACGVKYTAVGLALAVGVYVAWHMPYRAVLNGLIFAVVVFFSFAPWLVKGILLYQNPIYPYVFGGVNWDARRAAQDGGGLIETHEIWQLPILPFAATILGADSGAPYGFSLGPWLWTLPLLVLLGWPWLSSKARQLARDCALLGIPLLLVWMVIAALSANGTSPRLFTGLLPITAVAGSVGLAGVSRWPKKPLNVAFILRCMIVITLVFSVLEAVSKVDQWHTVSYMLASINRTDFVTDKLGDFNFAMDELTKLPPGSSVRFMWEPRSYYCPSLLRCAPDIMLDYWTRPLLKGTAPDATFDQWQQGGDDYLLLWDNGHSFFVQSDPVMQAANPHFLAALNRHMVPVWTDTIGYTLYRWRRSSDVF